MIPKYSSTASGLPPGVRGTAVALMPIPGLWLLLLDKGTALRGAEIALGTASAAAPTGPNADEPEFARLDGLWGVLGGGISAALSTHTESRRQLAQRQIGFTYAKDLLGLERSVGIATFTYLMSCRLCLAAR